MLRRALLVGGLTAALGGGIIWMPRLFDWPWLLLWNAGESMPQGLYMLQHVSRAEMGEVVVLVGVPRWTRAWLMKEVVGTAGARFCWLPEAGHHELDGVPFAPPSELAEGLDLKPWPGCRIVADDEVVLRGDGDSYDSRYFGPSQRRLIVGVYRPLVTLP